MDTFSWTDNVTNEIVLERVGEEMSIDCPKEEVES